MHSRFSRNSKLKLRMKAVVLSKFYELIEEGGSHKTSLINFVIILVFDIC